MISKARWVSSNGLGLQSGVLTKGCGSLHGAQMVQNYTRRRSNRNGAQMRWPFPAVKRRKVEVKRVCEDCKATSSPLWRSGPTGPRTLCNACGIKYRRKKKKKEKMRAENSSINDQKNESSSSTTEEAAVSYDELIQKQKEKQMRMLLLLGCNSNLKNHDELMKKKMMKKGTKNTVTGGNKEAEEAALLLLSLSSSHKTNYI